MSCDSENNDVINEIQCVVEIELITRRNNKIKKINHGRKVRK